MTTQDLARYIKTHPLPTSVFKVGDQWTPEGLVSFVVAMRKTSDAAGADTDQPPRPLDVARSLWVEMALPGMFDLVAQPMYPLTMTEEFILEAFHGDECLSGPEIAARCGIAYHSHFK